MPLLFPAPVTVTPPAIPCELPTSRFRGLGLTALCGPRDTELRSELLFIAPRARSALGVSNLLAGVGDISGLGRELDEFHVATTREEVTHKRIGI